MGFILTLLGNKNAWIVIVVGAIASGAWFKIHGLEGKVVESQKALAAQVEANKALESNNATLHQSLDMALSVNEANAKLLDSLKHDQELAADSLKKLSTDLSTSKATLSQAKARLAASTLPIVPVPQRIVDAIVVIQDSRTEQAILNKKAEAEE